MSIDNIKEALSEAAIARHTAAKCIHDVPLSMACAECEASRIDRLKNLDATLELPSFLLGRQLTPEQSEVINRIRAEMDKNATPPPVAQLLENATDLFRERNALYGDTFIKVGYVMEVMFRDVEMPLPRDMDSHDWNRMDKLMQIAGKLCRYASNMGSGGHMDSAQDMIVYAAMLQNFTEE